MQSLTLLPEFYVTGSPTNDIGRIIFSVVHHAPLTIRSLTFGLGSEDFYFYDPTIPVSSGEMPWWGFASHSESLLTVDWRSLDGRSWGDNQWNLPRLCKKGLLQKICSKQYVSVHVPRCIWNYMGQSKAVADERYPDFDYSLIKCPHRFTSYASRANSLSLICSEAGHCFQARFWRYLVKRSMAMEFEQKFPIHTIIPGPKSTAFLHADRRTSSTISRPHRKLTEAVHLLIFSIALIHSSWSIFVVIRENYGFTLKTPPIRPQRRAICDAVRR